MSNEDIIEFIGIMVLSYIFVVQFTKDPSIELTFLIGALFFIAWKYLKKRKLKKVKKEKDEEVIVLN
jgi:uncharacterized membrane protein